MAQRRAHCALRGSTRDLRGDVAVNALLVSTTMSSVGNVLIVQQARTSQAQRKPRQARAWRVALVNIVHNLGCKWSQSAVSVLPMRALSQQVRTF